MKRSILVLVILVSGVAPSWGEDVGPSSIAYFDAGVNVVDASINLYEANFEWAILKNLSLRGEVGYSPDFFWFTNLSLFEFYADVRWYLSGKGVEGWYGEFDLGVIDLTHSQSDSDLVFGSYTLTSSSVIPSIGVAIGYKFILGQGQGISLEPFAGYDLGYGTVSVSSNNPNVTYQAPALFVQGIKLGANAGWAY